MSHLRLSQGRQNRQPTETSRSLPNIKRKKTWEGIKWNFQKRCLTEVGFKLAYHLKHVSCISKWPFGCLLFRLYLIKYWPLNETSSEQECFDVWHILLVLITRDNKRRQSAGSRRERQTRQKIHRQKSLANCKSISHWKIKTSLSPQSLVNRHHAMRIQIPSEEWSEDAFGGKSDRNRQNNKLVKLKRHACRVSFGWKKFGPN